MGRICMDQTMLDVTDIEDVKTGDEVVVFGTAKTVSLLQIHLPKIQEL